MSLDWKLQRSLANRSHNLMFFLAMSLLLHGAIFLALAVYWRRFMQPLRTLEAPIPVEFIESSADTAVKPPLDTKRRASINSRAGGTQHELPLATGALEVRPKFLSPANQLNLTRPKASSQSNQLVHPPQPPQPTLLPSASPQVTNRSEAANPANQHNVNRFKVPTPQPIAVQSPQPSQPALPLSSLPLPKDASETEPKIPLPVSQPNITRSKVPTPQPIQPALLSSLLSLATDVFKARPQTPAKQPNSTQLRVITSQSSHLHSPQPAPLSPSSLAMGTSKTRRKARLPASPPNVSRPKAITPQSSHLHSLQTTRLAASGLTGGRNIKSPVAPTSSKPRSSSGLSQGQASLLGGTIAMNSHDFMSNRDNIPNADRPSTDPNGADARKDSDMGPYLDRLRQQVTEQWPHQEINSFKQTIVVFSISRDGHVTGLGIFQSSGSIPIDAAALGAVQRAAPFEPLPESFPGDHYPIQFKFTINAFGQLDVH